MSAVPENPTPPPPGKGARLGELLIDAGLITPEQLEENLAVHRATGKPLGHVLVENQVVHAHSIAMALAEQHGGPLKTEFGFAVGRSLPSGTSARAGVEQPSVQPLLRLAPIGGPVEPPAPLVAPAAPVPQLLSAPLEPQAPQLLSAPLEPQAPQLLSAPLEPQAPQLLSEPQDSAPAPEPAPLTIGGTIVQAQLEAETGARLAAEARETQLVAVLDELRMEIPAAESRGAEHAAAPLREEIEEIRRVLEEQTAILNATKGELAEALATEEGLRAQLDAERSAKQEAVSLLDVVQTQLADLRAQTATYETAIAAGDAGVADLRDQLAAERATGQQTAASIDALQAEVEALRAVRAQDVAAAEQALATALEDSASLRNQLAAERSTGQQTTASIDALQAEVEALRAVRAQDAAAAEQALATALEDSASLRDQLAAERETGQQTTASIDALKAEVEDLRALRAQDAAAVERSLADAREAMAALDAAQSARDEEATAANELRARVTELEQGATEGHLSAVGAADAEVEALRYVVELQEQALAAAEARERTLRDRPTPPAVDSSARRPYAESSHYLFAPGAEGYELFERSGSAPAIGSSIDLSGGRTFRVSRIGPAPYPGAREACAYLESA